MCRVLGSLTMDAKEDIIRFLGSIDLLCCNNMRIFRNHEAYLESITYFRTESFVCFFCAL